MDDKKKRNVSRLKSAGASGKNNNSLSNRTADKAVPG